MAAKPKTVFSCQSCGYQTGKWLGKCPDCNGWNTFAEETFSKAGAAREAAGFLALTSAEPARLEDIPNDRTPRFATGLAELDRVLGGGVVPGSLVLLGGDPGIGKSTLVLHTLSALVKSGVSVLYVTGEESREQIRMRADRLGANPQIMLVAENSLERIIQHIEKIKPQVVVIDSIQTVFMEQLESAPGSIMQVRECAGKLLYYSKTHGTATWLIGHVTKEGALAGPRILEHMVDTVLYFEGETSGQFRILRTMKNRYGSTNEIGIFEMTSEGLMEVDNPSRIFLSSLETPRVGSCVVAALEGTRPLLVEVQALVSGSTLANPRRTTVGVDSGRVALLIAVMEKVLGLNLYAQDVYVNAAGGLKLVEPAADLAVLLALMSSFRNRSLPPRTLAFGEVGLTGEVRAVGFPEKRLQEAAKLGLKRVLMPEQKLHVGDFAGLEIMRIRHVSELADYLN